MFFERRAAAVKSETKTVYADFSDKTNVKAFVEKTSKNAVVKYGKLCSSRKTAEVSDRKVTSAYALPYGTLLFDGKKGVVGTKEFTSTLVDPVYVYCKNTDTLVVSQKGIGTYLLAEDFKKASNLGFTSLTFFKERVFGVTEGKVYFTQTADFTDWQGYIQLPEDVVAVTSANDAVYAVGNGIFKIQFDAAEENTKITQLCRNVGKVFCRTVATLGNSIVFLTEKALCKFSSGKLQTIHKGEYGDNQNAVAAVYQNRYYLNCTEEERGAALLEYDDDLQLVSAYEGVNFLTAGTKLLFGSGGKALQFEDSPAELFWQSEICRFGSPYGKKHFRKLLISTKNNADVHLITENERRIYHIFGSPVPQKINICGAFYGCTVEIYGCDAEISEIGVQAVTYEV